MKKIPAGYRVIVTSWENDADNYKTEAVQGLSPEATKFVIALIKLFYSKNTRTLSYPCFGNMCDPSDGQIKACYAAIEAVMSGYSDILKEDPILGEYFESPDIMFEFLSEVGLTGSSEFFWTRVLDFYEVEYYPHDIFIEDVTDQF